MGDIRWMGGGEMGRGFGGCIVLMLYAFMLIPSKGRKMEERDLACVRLRSLLVMPVGSCNAAERSPGSIGLLSVFDHQAACEEMKHVFSLVIVKICELIHIDRRRAGAECHLQTG